MRVKNIFAALCLFAALVTTIVPSTVLADELIERVVVRNRLYSMNKRFEVGADVGFTLLGRLTDHINLNAILGYNFADSFGIELRGGWAFSRHTGLANQLSTKVFDNPTSITEDLSGLWEMKGNGAVGVRWAPIYGKISLLAEVPVHYQFYLWGGGGVGTFERESVVICTGLDNTGAGCGDFFVDTKFSGFGSAALGFRFFTHQGGSVKLEIRDNFFPDSYRRDIVRGADGVATDIGTAAPSPGLTHLVLVNLGYVFIF
jgi:outer membrane beta-barrel protein